MNDYKISTADLEKIMREALAADGFPACKIEGWIYAETRYGFLRPGVSQEMRDQVELHYVLPPATGFA